MAREKVKTLSAMEAELRSTEYFGKGIKVAAGFDLGTAAPLDSRSIVKTLSARDKFATDKLAYEGMQVYVEEDQKQYIFKDGEWVEFGFNASDAGEVVKDAIVNDLTTGGEDKALSAEQGKILKEEIDDVKTLLGNKNSNTQIFETSKEFQTWAESAEPKLGDLVFIIEHKRSYIYKGVEALLISEEPFVVPAGWVLFDEISTEIDLIAYAKKAELEEVKEELESLITANTQAIAQEISDREKAVQAEKTRAEAAEAELQEELTNVEERVTQLETDLVENAQAIIAIEARRFILTRSQEIVTIEADKLTYPITMPNNGNAIVDVIKNSVVLVNGVDYTCNATEITFKKQYAEGSQIHILKTYNEPSPVEIPEIGPVVGNAIVGDAIVGK